MIDNLLLAACSSPSSSLTCFFGAGSNVWFPIVMLASLLIITVVAVVYQLSPLLGRNDIKVWARAKIYDGLITIIFALIFLSFSTLVLTVNPVNALYSAGIVPTSCNSGMSASNAPSSSNVADIYGLADCEIYAFNNDAASFSEGLFILGIIGGINPQSDIQIPDTISTATGAGVGVSFQIQFLPIVLVHQYIVPYMQAYFLTVLVSQLLQILVNSAPLLFSIFMILGLVARSFGITKSFGGAMIAFGLGLGFIYPLMVVFTYGFLDTAIQNAYLAGGAGFPELFNLAPTMLTGLLSAIPTIISDVFSSGPSGILPALLAAFEPTLNPLIIYGGFVGAGLVLIPMLTLIVVDAFIVDFSRAIGERMDLFSLLTRML